jgi:hypothetical protein
MAGTGGDDNTADRRLVLCAKEFSFIVACTLSEPLATEVVLSILREGARSHDGGPPRFSFWTVEGRWTVSPLAGIKCVDEGLPMFQAPSPFDGEFYRSNPDAGVCFKLDPKNSSAHWRGPRRYRAGAPRELIVEELKNCGGKLPPVDVHVIGIMLRHDVVLAKLRFIGWLPAEHRRRAIAGVGATGQVGALTIEAPNRKAPVSSPAQQSQQSGGPALDPEDWLRPMQRKFRHIAKKERSKWVRDVAFPQMQKELEDKAPWKIWESLKRALYQKGRKKVGRKG